MLFATVSKLPDDLFDVAHVLPGWLKYIELTFWAAGLLLAASLSIHLIGMWWRYRREVALRARNKKPPVVELSRSAVKIRLENLLKAADQSGIFRPTLHEFSAVMRTYLETRLKKNVEEMSTEEIRIALKRDDLATYFYELSVNQFGRDDPDRKTALYNFNKSLDLLRKI